MLKRFFSPRSLWQDEGLSLIRIMVGLFITYHGLEVFEKDKILGYSQWLTDLHVPAPHFMAYLGKDIEFAAGLFFLLGLFTRLMVIPLALTMSFICFIMSHGKIFTDDQHPFLFVLIFLIYFFTGPGKWSLDNLIFKANS